MDTQGGGTGDHLAEPLERVSDGYLELDSDWQVTAVNSAGTELFGADRELLLGRPLDETVPDVVASTLRERIEESIATGETAGFEEYFPLLSRWLEGTVYPTGDGVSVVVRDVTERERIRQDRAKRELALEQLHDIASNIDLSRDEKVRRILEVGVERLNTDYGFVTRIEDGTQEIVESVGDHPDLQPGATAPLSESYCRHTLAAGETLAVQDAPREGWEDDPAYDRFDLDCYLGVQLYVNDTQYGTVCFAGSNPHSRGFDEHERTFVELLTDWIHHLLEEQAYERELEQQQAFTEGLMNSLPDPLYAVDESGRFLRWNDRLEAVTGYDPGEIASMDPLDLVAEADRERVSEAFDSMWEADRVSVEATLETSDGKRIPYEFSGAPLFDESGEVIGLTGVGRDVTEQKAHRERLSRILETTRSLMQARDRNHVGELAANAASELLGEDLSVFRLYNSDEGTVEPIATTDAVDELIGSRPVYGLGEGYPGEVFASGEPRVVADLADSEFDYNYGAARSAICYPVGVHGTITVASTEPNAFDETDRHVLGLLATSAAAACMRAKRMREVREAREHTEQVLERVNGLVENTVEVLVQATTREEVEGGVVRELAAADPYSFAWIGQPDVTTETLRPTAWDGDLSLPIDGWTFDLRQDEGPVSEAYRERLPQIRTGIDGDTHGQWADAVADSEVDSLIVIPLVYKDATYGVLTVYAEEGDVFDERERVVLEALGRAVANAINAVERGRILDATEIIECEFAVDDRELLFSRLSAGSDSRLEAVGIDYRSDGRVRLYLSGEGSDPEQLLELARGDSQVVEVTCIVQHDDECLLELVVEESLLAILAEYGAVPGEVVAEGGTTRFTVELPYEAEARELFDLVDERYPGTELLGYHERERPVETRQDFKAALGDRLTDRQETALRTAYLGGFFNWPRDVDGNELADAMGISRPTYHQHLRSAQAKVFEELFE